MNNNIENHKMIDNNKKEILIDNNNNIYNDKFNNDYNNNNDSFADPNSSSNSLNDSMNKIEEMQMEENDNDKNIDDMKVKKDSKQLQNLMIVYDLRIKLFTLISIFFCIITITFNLGVCIKTKKIINIKINDKFLTMNFVMFIILLIILNSFNVGLLFYLYYKKEDQICKIIYKNLQYYFVLTEVIFGGSFVTGLFFEPDTWTYIFNETFYLTNIILFSFFFIDIKYKKNLNISANVFISYYLSILFAFIIYITTYNLALILCNNLNERTAFYEEDYDGYKSTICFFVIFLQTLISITLLAYIKDVFFGFTNFYIILALLIHKDSSYENLTIFSLIIFCILLFLSCIFTIYKKGYSVLGIDKNNDINLTKNQKSSN